MTRCGEGLDTDWPGEVAGTEGALPSVAVDHGAIHGGSWSNGLGIGGLKRGKIGLQ